MINLKFFFCFEIQSGGDEEFSFYEIVVFLLVFGYKSVFGFNRVCMGLAVYIGLVGYIAEI